MAKFGFRSVWIISCLLLVPAVNSSVFQDRDSLSWHPKHDKNHKHPSIDNDHQDIEEGRDLTTNCAPGDVVPPNRVNTTAQLKALRVQMAAESIDAYLLPRDRVRVPWISGFTGSSATILVTRDQAALWTDSRYFLAAASQLDCNWHLMKLGLESTPSQSEWLSDNLSKGSVIGSDPVLLGASAWLNFKSELVEEGLDLVESKNLIDEIYTVDNGRPVVKMKKPVVYTLKFAGQEWMEKVAALRASLKEENISAIVITELDEVAWLFNLRGEGANPKDSLYKSPIFESMALITKCKIILYMPLDMPLSDDLSNHLAPKDCKQNHTCVEVRDITAALADLASEASSISGKISMVAGGFSPYISGVSYAQYKAIPDSKRVLEASRIEEAKSMKNEAEVAGMLSGQLKEAYAFCEFAYTLEYDVVNDCEDWDEISASNFMSQLRRDQPGNKGDSFKTISAFGPNAALPHYSSTPETNRNIDNSSVYLIDTGGQYIEGSTTDTTRTFHFGKPNPDMVSRYTNVLQGHIDLARLVFKWYITPENVDILARQPLWKNGLDFGHGVGHGIGAYLGVHEGPTLIGWDDPEGQEFLPNQFFSDEPGYYMEGHFGIRLESILRVVKKEFKDKSKDGFLAFDSITFVPFEPKLIDISMLSKDQIMWLNEYNQKIRQKVSPHFRKNGKTEISDWIDSKTAPIPMI